MNTPFELLRFESAPELADAAAERILQAALRAVVERERFIIALAGGSTPRQTYERLSDRRRATRMPWRDTFVLWTDERCVPPDNPGCNYRMACESLLDRVPIPADNLLRIRGERCALAEDAHYERALHRLLGPDGRIDLTLLGVGADGHTASLFPNAPAVIERERWVLPTQGPPPYPRRITLTLPILNASRAVLVLVAGQEKSHIVAAVRSGKTAGLNWPILRVEPRDGPAVWLVDAAAWGE